MHILVTGAAGFIGSHLVESLDTEGHEVVSFVKPCSDISSIARLGSRIVYGDICDRAALKKAAEGIDIVYHLAAIPNWHGGVSRQEYEAVNTEGTRNILEACRLNQVKRLVFTSSLEAVGPSRDGEAVNEETAPVPVNIYGETKLRAEEIVTQYHKQYGLKTVIVRLPAVYGPRNMLHLKRYFKMAKKGWYPIVGNGTSLIEFCYVKNAISGLKAAMEKGKAGEIYFISDERSYQFREVIEAIANQLNINMKFISMPAFVAKGVGFSFEVLSKFLKFYPFFFKEMGRPAFSRKSVDWMVKNTLFCDISKAKRELGYKTSFTLQNGIRETAEWYSKIGVL